MARIVKSLIIRGIGQYSWRTEGVAADGKRRDDIRAALKSPLNYKSGEELDFSCGASKGKKRSFIDDRCLLQYKKELCNKSYSKEEWTQVVEFPVAIDTQTKAKISHLS